MSMNTANNHPPLRVDGDESIGRQLVRALDAHAIHLPLDQTMQELQVIVERVTFGSESIGDAMKSSDIRGLLEGDISPEMLSFVSWVCDQGLARLFAGASGRHFLSFCVQYYRDIQEVICKVAVALSAPARMRLLAELRGIYPEPTRIIFEPTPSLLAGCSISDGHAVTDMSLEHQMVPLVAEYVAARRPLKRMPHGQ